MYGGFSTFPVELAPLDLKLHRLQELVHNQTLILFRLQYCLQFSFVVVTALPVALTAHESVIRRKSLLYLPVVHRCC